MNAAIASVFRAMNAQLLYTQGLIHMFFKAWYFVSVFFFRRWMRRKRPSQIITISYDKDLKIQVDMSKWMGASLYWTGFHEFNEMRFLHAYLKPHMTFVDLGANQGEFALFAAKRLSNGQVLAFEPMSFSFDRLTFNVNLNSMSNIKCFRLAVSDKIADVPMYSNADEQTTNEGIASLFPVSGENLASETVSLVALDEVVRREGVRSIDFIKMDVEGSEWAVLRGSQEILKRDKPALMIELCDATAAMAGFQVDDMIQWLKEFGYEPYRMVKRGLEPLINRPPLCNAVFLTR